MTTSPQFSLFMSHIRLSLIKASVSAKISPYTIWRLKAILSFLGSIFLLGVQPTISF